MMRINKLFAKLRKCVRRSRDFDARLYVSKSGVRGDPEKISSICFWPIPRNVKVVR
jgi:hypothetical protein